MALTDDEIMTLRSRYKDWGVDTVRSDLRRPSRNVFMSPDRDKFAHDWVDESDAKVTRREKRKERLVKILMVAAAIEFGVVMGLRIPF